MVLYGRSRPVPFSMLSGAMCGQSPNSAGSTRCDSMDATSLKIAQFQLLGTAYGASLCPPGGTEPKILRCASFNFSEDDFLMRSNIWSAGSSAELCGTSFPRTASSKIISRSLFVATGISASTPMCSRKVSGVINPSLAEPPSIPHGVHPAPAPLRQPLLCTASTTRPHRLAHRPPPAGS